MFELRENTIFRHETLLPGDMVQEAEDPVGDLQEEDQVASEVAAVALAAAELQEDGDEKSRNPFYQGRARTDRADGHRRRGQNFR
jgi:hypothetical protein